MCSVASYRPVSVVKFVAKFSKSGDFYPGDWGFLKSGDFYLRGFGICENLGIFIPGI